MGWELPDYEQVEPERVTIAAIAEQMMMGEVVAEAATEREVVRMRGVYDRFYEKVDKSGRLLAMDWHDAAVGHWEGEDRRQWTSSGDAHCAVARRNRGSGRRARRAYVRRAGVCTAGSSRGEGRCVDEDVAERRAPDLEARQAVLVRGACLPGRRAAGQEAARRGEAGSRAGAALPARAQEQDALHSAS